MGKVPPMVGPGGIEFSQKAKPKTKIEEGKKNFGGGSRLFDVGIPPGMGGGPFRRRLKGGSQNTVGA